MARSTFYFSLALLLCALSGPTVAQQSRNEGRGPAIDRESRERLRAERERPARGDASQGRGPALAPGPQPGLEPQTTTVIERPGISPAEMRRRENEAIQQGQAVTRGQDRLEKFIDLLADVIAADPRDKGPEAIEKSLRALYDRAGMCENCEAERRMASEAETKNIIEAAKELAEKRRAAENRPRE